MAADANTKLLLHFNGNDGAKEIVDSGNTGHITTQTGTASISIAQQKWGACSLFLDGGSDNISIPTSADFNVFGAADENWTIDFWMRTDDAATLAVVLGQWEDENNKWRLELLNNDLTWVCHSGASDIVTLTTTANPIAAANTWYHIALIKKSAEYGIYVGGTQYAFVDDSSTDTFTGSFFVGVDGAAIPAKRYGGYIDELRIINADPFGAAPNVGLSDTIVEPTGTHTSDADTKLLLHFESQDDSSPTAPKIPTFVADAQLDTAQSKFSSLSSLLLDGTGDYVHVPTSSDWNVGSGEWTLDFWVRFNDKTGEHAFVSSYLNDSNYWKFRKNADHTLECVFKTGGVGTGQYITDAAAVSADDTWYHIAFVRSSNDCLIFVDGTKLNDTIGVTETTAFGTLPTLTGAVLRIGYEQENASYMDGWLEEVRFSNTARWTANFTPRTKEYGTGTGYSHAVMVG